MTTVRHPHSSLWTGLRLRLLLLVLCVATLVAAALAETPPAGPPPHDFWTEAAAPARIDPLPSPRNRAAEGPHPDTVKVVHRQTTPP